MSIYYKYIKKFEDEKSKPWSFGQFFKKKINYIRSMQNFRNAQFSFKIVYVGVTETNIVHS